MKLALPASTLMLLALTACNPAPAPQDAVVPPADQPTGDVPPATAPTPDAAGTDPTAGLVGLAGYGSASFGMDVAALRKAVPELGEGKPDEPGGCHYLPLTRASGEAPRVSFMIEGDKFVRIDVDSSAVVAPGGGRIGMGVDQIDALYAGRVEKLPNKYVPAARDLRIKDADGGTGVLMFQADEKGSVHAWHVGIPPQVDYVEGCS